LQQLDKELVQIPTKIADRYSLAACFSIYHFRDFSKYLEVHEKYQQYVGNRELNANQTLQEYANLFNIRIQATFMESSLQTTFTFHSSKEGIVENTLFLTLYNKRWSLLVPTYGFKNVTFDFSKVY
jgi:hypothetical protein